MTDSEEYEEIPIAEVFPDEELPSDVYLKIAEKFIKFKHAGDTISPDKYNYFVFKNLKTLRVPKNQVANFNAWVDKIKKKYLQIYTDKVGVENKAIAESYVELNKKLYETFAESEINESNVQNLKIQASEYLKNSIKSKTSLQIVTRLNQTDASLARHSINVANLAVYLAFCLGHTHEVVLENIFLGALMHDYGKTKLDPKVLSNPDQHVHTLRLHPQHATDILKNLEVVPPQVVKIVAEHHEQHNGQGFPKGMSGDEIYTQSKIVSIANMIDNIQSQFRGNKLEGLKKAIKFLEYDHGKYFEPKLALDASKAMQFLLEDTKSSAK